jgi:hypothetical protein
VARALRASFASSLQRTAGVLTKFKQRAAGAAGLTSRKAVRRHASTMRPMRGTSGRPGAHREI